MRNWNWCDCCGSLLLRLVFIVPMRNWNIQVSFFWCCACERFYRTYEELKLLWSEWLDLNQRPRFYRTYEELKQGEIGYRKISNITFLSYLWGIETTGAGRQWSHAPGRFYRTYEELKPISPSKFVSTPAPFLSYLWGIETEKGL